MGGSKAKKPSITAALSSASVVVMQEASMASCCLGAVWGLRAGKWVLGVARHQHPVDWFRAMRPQCGLLKLSKDLQ